MIKAVAEFLKAARSLSKQGIKKEQVMEFAKREFGEVSDLLKRQIEQIFTPKSGGITSIKKPEGKVIEASFRPGKDKTGKVVEESPSQESGIMERIQGAANRLQQLQKEREAMFKPKGFDVAEGLTRTIARRILDKKNIQIGKRDPIDVYSDIFGEAITDVKNLADELIEIDAAGGGTKNLDEMIKQEGLFDIDIPENPQRGMSDDEFIKFLKDKGVDPDDTGFASGGRVQYAFGSGLKLAKVLAIRGKTIKDEIKKAIDNFIQPSGDKKLDADVILDDMLEELNINRSEIDEYDLLDAYGQIYDELSKPIAATLKNKSAPFTGKGIDLPDDVDPRDTILPTSEELAPKMIERFELRKKYPGIDDELLDQIIEMDPDKKAAMMADMEMGAKLIEEGKGVDEVKDIIEKGVKTRKDNAEGGLNYLMGM